MGRQSTGGGRLAVQPLVDPCDPASMRLFGHGNDAYATVVSQDALAFLKDNRHLRIVK